MEAQRWVADKTFSDCQLINVSQAAPVEPPPAALIDHMAKIIYDEDTHLYGPVLGLPALR